MTADEPEVIDFLAWHRFFQEQLQNAECEYDSLSPCTTLGCTVHRTTPTSPTISQNDFPALPKINPSKRKESDDGFVSPTRRQLIKKPNLILSPSFTLETGNKSSNLKEQEIAGASTSNTNLLANDTTPANDTTKNTFRHLLC
ncbi:hypothetical protein TNCV_4922651 [Trichonephila clavipes]|nr:hypothetical protein TNCV_4922651 [Trichonephila clavipes]